ncbi:transporter [Geotalea toluenoxydans]|uniref:transporter n=1 Tax=Geotalea toluenoxydans TaxID=421624 RepID=UPI0006CF62DA|nr:transporter [Geotalea toluenoxydans]
MREKILIITLVMLLSCCGTEAADLLENTSHHAHGGNGTRLLFNPAFGEDIYHTHSAGAWMVNYRDLHTNQKGLGAGSSSVAVEQVIPMNSPYGYMMTPTEMSMDMHMLMVMYGVNDRFTLMGMGTYQDNRMDMLMDMGMGMGQKVMSMRTSGIGDTELRGIYNVGGGIAASLGLTIPTGDIDQEFETMGMKFRAPYDMQLGSGSFDLEPVLAYSALTDDGLWNWGGQVSYIWHTNENNNGYRLGDTFKATSWVQRALGPVAGWLRLAFNHTGRIKGRDGEIEKLLDTTMGAPTPDAVADNYGGRRLDGFVGVSYNQGPFSVGVEGGLPLYQYVNGLQLKNDWYINAGIQFTL